MRRIGDAVPFLTLAVRARRIELFIGPSEAENATCLLADLRKACTPELGQKLDAAVPVLRQALRSDINLRVRYHAAFASRYFTPDRETSKTLGEVLASRDGEKIPELLDVSDCAGETLAGQGTRAARDALGSIAQAARHDNVRLRDRSFELLELIASDQAVPEAIRKSAQESLRRARHDVEARAQRASPQLQDFGRRSSHRLPPWESPRVTDPE